MNGCHGNVKAGALRVGLLDCGERLCPVQVESGSHGPLWVQVKKEQWMDAESRKIELAFPKEGQPAMRQRLGCSGVAAVRATPSLAIPAPSLVRIDGFDKNQ